MKIAYEKESRAEATRRYWEERHGIKIGTKVKFKVKETQTAHKSKGGAIIGQKDKVGVLVALYPFVALFDFNGIKRCIQNEMLWAYMEGRELEW